MEMLTSREKVQKQVSYDLRSCETSNGHRYVNSLLGRLIMSSTNTNNYINVRSKADK